MIIDFMRYTVSNSLAEFTMATNFTFNSDSQRSENHDPLHLLVMGNPDVGKRTLISRLLRTWNELDNQDKNNTGGDLEKEARDLTMKIHETSPKKSFQPFQRLPSCDVFLLVYSLVDDDSFQAVSDARDWILQERGPNVPIVFVANKTDIADSVDKNERVYRDLNISCEWEHGHVEVSAETDQSFYEVLRQVLKRHKKNVTENPQQKPQSGLGNKFRSLKKFFSRKLQKKD